MILFFWNWIRNRKYIHDWLPFWRCSIGVMIPFFLEWESELESWISEKLCSSGSGNDFGPGIITLYVVRTLRNCDLSLSSLSYRPDEVRLREPPAPHRLVLCRQPRPDDGRVVAVQGEVGAVAGKVQQRVIVHSPHGDGVRQDGRLEKGMRQ